MRKFTRKNYIMVVVAVFNQAVEIDLGCQAALDAL